MIAFSAVLIGIAADRRRNAENVAQREIDKQPLGLVVVRLNFQGPLR